MPNAAPQINARCLIVNRDGVGVGEKIGRLTLISETRIGRHFAFACVCECGAEKIVRAGHLRTRQTLSCGCYAKDRITAENTKHGEAKNGEVSPEYSSWRAMHKRCHQPRNISFPNYGGRGIGICKRWYKFENFLADMGRRPSLRHSIERKDNEGNYTPGNCIWGTPSQQAKNRRPRNRRANGTYA